MPPPLKVTITGLSKPPDASRDRGGGFAGRVSSFRLLSLRRKKRDCVDVEDSLVLFVFGAREMPSNDDTS